ncbi:MAG: hypothetical protein ACHQ49_00395 [Elusimicrobiota bacterium]
MNRMFAGLLLLLSSFAAGMTGDDAKSDLGEQGNIFVAKTFDAYNRLHPDGACRAQGSGKRVLVAGYGLFAGVPYNISGTVVRSMADPAFWPDHIELGGVAPAGTAAPRTGTVSSADAGAVAFNRTLLIDGERYEACFLITDVIWDLAGAILIREESLFKPRLILMTGRGTWPTSFEAGAINRASPYPGYDENGDPLGSINVPESKWILPDDPVDFTVPMAWNPEALAAASRSEIEALGYTAVGQPAARPENNYLCNDISYVALHASRNKSTSLAGGKVELNSPNLALAPVVGFMHFPPVDGSHPDPAAYGQGIFSWAKVVARTIKLASPADP